MSSLQPSRVVLGEGVLDQFGVDPAEVGDAGAGAVRGSSTRSARPSDSTPALATA